MIIVRLWPKMMNLIKTNKNGNKNQNAKGGRN